MTKTVYPYHSWVRAMGILDGRLVNVKGDGVDIKRAKIRMKMWENEQIFSTKKTSIDDFLCIFGANKDQLYKALGEPVKDTYERMPKPDFLSDIYSCSKNVDVLKENLGFIEIVRPLIEHQIYEIHSEINNANIDKKIFNLDRIMETALDSLNGELANMISKTMVLELNVMRVRNELKGKTSEERFSDFIRKIATPKYSHSILEEYPVLVKAIIQTVRQWKEVVTTIIVRLNSDIDEIRVKIGNENSSLITGVNFNLGDTHREGQSVATVSIGQKKIVYKPHSLKVDKQFNKLISWINEKGCKVFLKTPWVIDKEKYGWCEFIESAPCESESELVEFYRRHGALIALLYALSSADFHLENIVAAGAFPIPIDLEALLHPKLLTSLETETKQGTIPLVDEAMSDSVQGIGILPSVSVSDKEGDNSRMDMGGLSGGGTGAKTVQAVPTFTDVGKDKMHVVNDKVLLPPTSNLPVYNGENPDPLEYIESIIDGHATMYKFLMDNKSEILKKDGILMGFEKAEIRVIIRPTQTYAHMISQSFHPDLLRDKLDQDRFLSNLAALVTSNVSDRSSLIRSELVQIHNGDIPIFNAKAESKTIYGADSSVIEGFIDEPGLSRARRRISIMSNKDMEFHQWTIRGSMAALAMGQDEVVVASRDNTKKLPHSLDRGYRSSKLPSLEVIREESLTAALLIGDNLCQAALEDERYATWLGVSYIGEKLWAVGPCGPGFYSGSAGVGLFLLYLWQKTGIDRYKELAVKAIDGAIADVCSVANSFDEVAKSGVGLFSDLGGLTYVLAHASSVLKDESYYCIAKSMAKSLSSASETDSILDIAGGSAGAILAILALYGVQKDETLLSLTDKPKKKLVKSVCYDKKSNLFWRSPYSKGNFLTGYSHGISGISVSLARLAAEDIDRGNLVQIIREALSNENRTWSPEHRNWPDFRKISTDESVFGMCTWCHGSLGIALTRLDIGDALDLIDTKQDLERCADSAKYFYLHGGEEALSLGNYCICHGDLGNAEILMRLGAETHDDKLRNLAYRLVHKACKAVLLGDIRCGVPFGIQTPGLLNGIAGIGFSLLNFSLQENLPSILSLHSA